MYLSAPQPFCLEAEWLNAQAFRWTERGGWFYGIVGGQLIRVRNADGDRIEFEGKAAPDTVTRYFRLDQKDTRAVHAALRKADPEHMPGLVERYGHIRVLRQDPWECLVAYACSPRAKVEGISAKLDRLAKHYGEDQTLNGVTCRSIPSAEQLADAGVDKLRDLGLGLPSIASTLHEVATAVAGGNLAPEELANLPHAEAREHLRKKYDGIGYKIADCVCLFSLGHDGAFPVDANIGATLERYYEKKFTPGAKNVRLQEWAAKTFGRHAGYAGQLLFLDQRSRIREQQRAARYASEDSTIVTHPGVRLDVGEHPHDFEEISFLHIHDGWDEPHTHPRSEWPKGWDWE